LKSINGTFASPEYPSRYSEAVVCQWMIILPPRRKVKLQLYLLPPAGNVTNSCTDSYVKVFNGIANSSPVIGQYCMEVSLSQV